MKEKKKASRRRPAPGTLHMRSTGNTLPPPASRALRIHLGALIFHSNLLFHEIYCTALVETPDPFPIVVDRQKRRVRFASPAGLHAAPLLRRPPCVLQPRAVFRCKNQNSKIFFRHLHGDLNLNEIKNTLRLLSVNSETNLMNLIRL